MKKLVLILAMAAFALMAFAQAPTPQQAAGPLEFTVAVPAGGAASGVPLSLAGRALHFRCYAGEATGVEVCGFVKVRTSSGMLTSETIRKPWGKSGSYPSAADTTWTLLPSSVSVWNEFANVGVDSLFVYNTGLSEATVTFQLLLSE